MRQVTLPFLLWLLIESPDVTDVSVAPPKPTIARTKCHANTRSMVRKHSNTGPAQLLLIVMMMWIITFTTIWLIQPIYIGDIYRRYMLMWKPKDVRVRKNKDRKWRVRKLTPSLINSNSPCLCGGSLLHCFFYPNTSVFSSSPLLYSDLLVLLPSLSFVPRSFLFPCLSLCTSTGWFQLSSANSHFPSFQPFSFLSSTYSPILFPYCEFSLRVSSLSSIYWTIKWSENRVALARWPAEASESRRVPRP